jgi:hypothetical protein
MIALIWLLLAVLENLLWGAPRIHGELLKLEIKRPDRPALWR